MSASRHPSRVPTSLAAWHASRPSLDARLWVCCELTSQLEATHVPHWGCDLSDLLLDGDLRLTRPAGDSSAPTPTLTGDPDRPSPGHLPPERWRDPTTAHPDPGFVIAALVHHLLTGAPPAVATEGAATSTADELVLLIDGDMQFLRDQLRDESASRLNADAVDTLVKHLKPALWHDPTHRRHSLDNLHSCLVTLHDALAEPRWTPRPTYNTETSDSPAWHPGLVGALSLTAILLTGVFWVVLSGVEPAAPTEVPQALRVTATPLPVAPASDPIDLLSQRGIEVRLEVSGARAPSEWSVDGCSGSGPCLLAPGAHTLRLYPQSRDPVDLMFIINVDGQGAVLTARTPSGIITARPPRSGPLELTFASSTGLRLRTPQPQPE